MHEPVEVLKCRHALLVESGEDDAALLGDGLKDRDPFLANRGQHGLAFGPHIVVHEGRSLLIHKRQRAGQIGIEGLEHRSSFVGHEQDLIRPPESPQLDYEGEIVAVIGKGGRRIPQYRARDHLAGLALGNEGTIRDWVRHAKFNVTQGKNWDSSGSIGPWMVTLDEIGDFDDFDEFEGIDGI
ncbi:MAG: fumarylacetoacetate hydrolase family protein, partial [Acidobacteria bacterium]|nr:fumarylacetoacetate hydrolase family protein [Candidatus Sulfomarinibacter sp. MAG AM1]